METSIKGMKLNKGEWAEFYVMLKLLGEGKLYTANQYLQKNYKIYLDVLKIIREEYGNVLEYIIDDSNSTVVIKQKDEAIEKSRIPTVEFDKNAEILFHGIKKAKGNSIPAPDAVCEFAKLIYVTKPKAPSVKCLKKEFGGKNDIFIEIRDGQTATIAVVGFSIKSKFGTNPTLFNAGTSSQFLYKLTGCNDEKMKDFNEIIEGTGRGWEKCKAFLLEHNIDLEYVGTKNPIYENNLFLIRKEMSEILAWCVKDRLLDNLKGDHKVLETINRMVEKNPLNVSDIISKVYYEKAVKDFLMASFSGMTAGRAWDGREQVNGGYIVVTNSGDVLCYHSIDREAFRDYLYRNTYFEYVSTDKYKWSYIQKVDNEYYLPLNISVRFLKETR